MLDTTNYLILALAVTALLIGGLIASYWMRHRNLDRDVELIQQLSQDE